MSSLYQKTNSFYDLLGSEETKSKIHSPKTITSLLSESWTTLGLEQPLVIAMVGLPARGKSYLVRMLTRYLRWAGFDVKVFNVGSYRRDIGLASADSSFFDNANKDAQKVREDMAMMVQSHMYNWLHDTTSVCSHTGEVDKRRVAIFDATNTTISRRQALANKAREEKVFLLFVESICNDQTVLSRNYEMKLQNDDYKGMDPKVAHADFLSRVKAYEMVYETIIDTEDSGSISYIKLENVGEKMITRNCSGYLPSQVAFYLQNVHIQPRKIYLTLVAECLEHAPQSSRQKLYPTLSKSPSETSIPSRTRVSSNATLASTTSDYCNIVHNISTDLLDEGDVRSYASVDLLDFLLAEREKNSGLEGASKNFIVLLGNTQLHFDVSAAFKSENFPCYHTPILNELRGGLLHGLSKDEIKDQYPAEFQKRQENKLKYRYPGVGGESYLDVIERARPVIIELERQRQNMFLVCHLAVLRCVYAYFMGVDLPDIPFIEFKMNNIYELSPGPHGCLCTVIEKKDTDAPGLDLSLDALDIAETKEKERSTFAA